MKNNIQTYYKNITKNSNNDINFDIPTVLMNAKINKTFNKLLNLCIKYDIQLFDNKNDLWDIRITTEILNDINILKKKNIIDYSQEIINNSTSEKLIDDIDRLSNNLKKVLKDIDMLKYLFEDIYSHNELKKMCCIKFDDSISSNETKTSVNTKNSTYIKTSNSCELNDEKSGVIEILEFKNDIEDIKIKQYIKQKNSKYIAEYIN
jgi:hypothetical protein